MAICFGRSWTDIYDAIAGEYTGLFASEQDLVTTVREHCREQEINMYAAIPASVRVLRRLAARLLVAIVSGSSRGHIAENVLMLGISEQIEFFLGYEDYGKGKPDPTCYRLAARMLGVKPRRCLVIEDSAVGVRAAKAAGMSCIALAPLNGYPQELGEADVIVEDLEQVDFEQAQAIGERGMIQIARDLDPPRRSYSSPRPPTE